VVNSAALKLAGITSATADPFGGKLLRAKEGVGDVPAGVAVNEPNGMLLDRARGLIRVSDDMAVDPEKAALAADARSIMLGWCEVQDPGGSWRDVEVYRKLYGEGKLKVRIYKAISGPGAEADRLIQQGASVGEFGHRLTVRSIKVVSDGALGSRGAALLAPYSDNPQTSGFLTVKEEALRPMLMAALKNGIQVETHAIGDKANRFVLDEYARAMAAVPSGERKIKEPRWRDEHSQIVSPQDLPRFKKLGVIPSMQPSHAIGDLFFVPSRIGAQRTKGAYAWHTLIQDGNVIAGGSDAPVERGEPMIEYYAAVARKPLPERLAGANLDPAVWHPEQAMTREQALKALTLWPAYAAFEEDIKGTTAAGKLADFSVLSADITKIPEAEIPKTRNLMTIVGGEVVFQEK